MRDLFVEFSSDSLKKQNLLHNMFSFGYENETHAPTRVSEILLDFCSANFKN